MIKKYFMINVQMCIIVKNGIFYFQKIIFIILLINGKIIVLNFVNIILQKINKYIRNNNLYMKYFGNTMIKINNIFPIQNLLFGHQIYYLIDY